LLRPFFLVRGFRVVGASRLPKLHCPLILAANHADFIDSAYFMLAVRPRFTICGGKPRLFRNGVMRALMALANVLKVDGHQQYLHDCCNLLLRGEILLIYPEMGRFPNAMGEFKTWAAEVALASGAPILPCYLYGTTRGHAGNPKLYVGRPMKPRGGALELTVELRQAIEALAPSTGATS
jgi:1-acyl-sn-glycerol-3-phosphate acyltransferase